MIYQIEDKDVYRWLREQTGCGLNDAKVYLNQLIEAIKHQPIHRTDSKLKLIYESHVMSCYETHKGILRKVDTEGKSIQEFLRNISLGEHEEFQFDEDYDINDILYDLDLDDEYVYINDTLYKWYYHSQKFDEEENFCEVTPLEDGSIKIFAQFYNGGCCLEELLEDKLK